MGLLIWTYHLAYKAYKALHCENCEWFFSVKTSQPNLLVVQIILKTLLPDLIVVNCFHLLVLLLTVIYLLSFILILQKSLTNDHVHQDQRTYLCEDAFHWVYFFSDNVFLCLVTISWNFLKISKIHLKIPRTPLTLIQIAHNLQVILKI